MARDLTCRMTELTDHIPKCMLPVVGVPLFWYPLNFLQRNSIHDVFLIVNEKHAAEVKLLLTQKSLPPLDDLHIEVLVCNNDDFGTADVLRHFASKIKKNFIVISGDFVSDMTLEPVLSLHRSENSALTCVFAENVVSGQVPGPKIKRNKGRDLIALSTTNQLLFMASEEDVDQSVQLSPSLLWKYKVFNLTAKYNDCHVYLMKRFVLDILCKERTMSSLKVDLIPFILERQYTTIEPDIASHLESDGQLDLINHFNCGIGDEKAASKLRCFAYLVTPENGTIIAHVNNLGSYFELNKRIIRFLPTRFNQHFPAGLKNNASMDRWLTALESYISETVHFADSFQPTDSAIVTSNTTVTPPSNSTRIGKTIVKRSVIGSNTHIGVAAKITNSLIMDSCNIGSGVLVCNSIICSGVTIEDGAEVTSSIVACKQRISTNS